MPMDHKLTDGMQHVVVGGPLNDPKKHEILRLLHCSDKIGVRKDHVNNCASRTPIWKSTPSKEARFGKVMCLTSDEDTEKTRTVFADFDGLLNRSFEPYHLFLKLKQRKLKLSTRKNLGESAIGSGWELKQTTSTKNHHTGRTNCQETTQYHWYAVDFVISGAPMSGSIEIQPLHHRPAKSDVRTHWRFYRDWWCRESMRKSLYAKFCTYIMLLIVATTDYVEKWVDSLCRSPFSSEEISFCANIVAHVYLPSITA